MKVVDCLQLMQKEREMELLTYAAVVEVLQPLLLRLKPSAFHFIPGSIDMALVRMSESVELHVLQQSPAWLILGIELSLPPDDWGLTEYALIRTFTHFSNDGVKQRLEATWTADLQPHVEHRGQPAQAKQGRMAGTLVRICELGRGGSRENLPASQQIVPGRINYRRQVDTLLRQADMPKILLAQAA